MNTVSRLIIKILVIALVFFSLFHFVIGVTIVHTNDNFPSIKDGDLVVYWKLGEAYTGDMVVYKTEEKTHIGRVVAVAEDVVNFTEGGFTVNDTFPYETVYYETVPYEGEVNYPYTVETDSYFILNDYRHQMSDSRMYGSVSDLKGKIIFIFRGRNF